jgi:RNA polymerase sigma-70 factor (ECF subfamily)
VYLRLVADYQAAILNYLTRWVGDVHVAEDLTQETFLKAYRALGRLELGEDAEPRRRAWLYRIAHNAATDHQRRQARWGWLSIDALRERAAEPAQEEPAERDLVRRAMASLGLEHREVLYLFGQAELSGSEVAQVLGISPEAARKRRQRAREAFVAAYQALGGELPR